MLCGDVAGEVQPRSFLGFKGTCRNTNTRWDGCFGNDVKWAQHSCTKAILGGGFKYFLFSSLFGEHSHFDLYFLDGLKPPTRIELRKRYAMGFVGLSNAHFDDDGI